MRPERATKLKLAEEQYSELNAILYESDPAEYLQVRLDSLLRRYSTESLPVPDVVIGNLQVRDWIDGTSDRQRMALALDGEILLHHAGESLIRLFMAHSGRPKCPWLDVVRLKDLNLVKGTMQGFVDGSAPPERERVAEVFVGGLSADITSGAATQVEWDSSIDAYCDLLRSVSGHLLEGASLYNAAKHGMVGVVADIGEIVARFDQDQQTRVFSGLGATYLQRKSRAPKGAPDHELWHLVTETIAVESSLMRTSVVITAIRSLWAAANAYYRGLDDEVVLLSRDVIHAAALAGTKDQLPTKITYKLHAKEKGKPWGQGLRPARFHLEVKRPTNDVLEAADRWAGSDQRMRKVAVSGRPREIPQTGSRPMYLFPISPADSASVWEAP